MRWTMKCSLRLLLRPRLLQSEQDALQCGAGTEPADTAVSGQYPVAWIDQGPRISGHDRTHGSGRLGRSAGRREPAVSRPGAAWGALPQPPQYIQGKGRQTTSIQRKFRPHVPREPVVTGDKPLQFTAVGGLGRRCGQYVRAQFRLDEQPVPPEETDGKPLIGKGFGKEHGEPSGCVFLFSG